MRHFKHPIVYIHTWDPGNEALQASYGILGMRHFKHHLYSVHTVFALTYGTAKNNCNGDHSALIRMC